MAEPDEPDGRADAASRATPRLDDAAADDARPRRGRARRVALLSLRLVAGTVAVVAAAVDRRRRRPRPGPDGEHRAARASQVVPVAADQLRVCAGLRAAPRRRERRERRHPDRDRRPVGARRRASARRSTASRSAPVRRVDRRHRRGARRCCASQPGDGAAIAGRAVAGRRRARLRRLRRRRVRRAERIDLAGRRVDGGRPHQHPDPHEPDGGRRARDADRSSARRAPIEAPGHERHRRAGRARSGCSRSPASRPGCVSPVVHVEARGGQVTASLQQSIVRGLDAVGVDLVDAAPDPATDLTFPGVRIFDSVGTNRALSLDDWGDVAPIVRILNPGTDGDRGHGQRHPARPGDRGDQLPGRRPSRAS